jgi:hypothetical protein
MKKITLIIAFLIYSVAGFSTTWTVVASGSFGKYAFSPASITVTLGDTVIFFIANIHSALEVSHASWNAGSVTPLSGRLSSSFWRWHTFNGYPAFRNILLSMWKSWPDGHERNHQYSFLRHKSAECF